MITEQGKMTLNVVKWGLDKLSIEVNDTQLLLLSIIFLLIILIIMVIIFRKCFNTSEK